MKMLVKFLKVVLPVAGIMIYVSACQKNTAPKVKSATVIFKAAAKKVNNKSTASLSGLSFSVKGGTLTLSSANVSFGNVNIQENTGNDGQGQYTGGSTAEGSDNESSKDSTDLGDIVLPGPFTYDMSTDTATLGKVQLYPGTFKKVDLTFMPNNNNLFAGNSIVIKGTFTPNAGISVPFTLQSKFAGQVELKLTKAITVSTNSKVSVAIVFDFSKWMGNLDFGTATQTAGTILINANHNTGLLSNFKTALSQQGADLNEEHGGTSGSDSETEGR